jgi:hypothetical protein
MPMGMILTTLYMVNNDYNGSGGRFPGTFYVGGSNDGSTWTLLYTTTVPSSRTLNVFIPFNINATQKYTYFRIVVNSIVLGGGSNSAQTVMAGIGQIKLQGTI